jgi:hypothetical protein
MGDYANEAFDSSFNEWHAGKSVSKDNGFYKIDDAIEYLNKLKNEGK